MVDRFLGSAIASLCAKSMLIDVSHTGHIPYSDASPSPACSGKASGSARVRIGADSSCSRAVDASRAPRSFDPTPRPIVRSEILAAIRKVWYFFGTNSFPREEVKWPTRSALLLASTDLSRCANLTTVRPTSEQPTPALLPTPTSS
jgi:hypothetical protein